MNCIGCKYAKWKTTDSGRLHPSGDGRCTYEYKLPPLPASMYWVGGPQKPFGGTINRREKSLEADCKYYVTGTK